jgi:hypothetical protein
MYIYFCLFSYMLYGSRVRHTYLFLSFIFRFFSKRCLWCNCLATFAFYSWFIPVIHVFFLIRSIYTAYVGKIKLLFDFRSSRSIDPLTIDNSQVFRKQLLRFFLLNFILIIQYNAPAQHPMVDVLMLPLTLKVMLL